MDKSKDLFNNAAERAFRRNSAGAICCLKHSDGATGKVCAVSYFVNGNRTDGNEYSYDRRGNIEAVKENGRLTVRYKYDESNRLIREDNVDFGTVVIRYNAEGGILTKTVYEYTLNNTPTNLIEVEEYDYSNRGRSNRLAAYCREACKYDILGNPVVYRDRTLTWRGKMLVSNGGERFFSLYAYDTDGRRISKRAVTPFGTVERRYMYDKGNLVAEERNGVTLNFFYDANGVAGFEYKGTTYLYRKSIFGDVTHIYKRAKRSSAFELAAKYAYDAWGDCKIVVNTDNVAELNPLRYRGYYFDGDTGLYYFRNRYYDYETGRYISADSIERQEGKLAKIDRYTYCSNNPLKIEKA